MKNNKEYNSSKNQSKIQKNIRIKSINNIKKKSMKPINLINN